MIRIKFDSPTSRIWMRWVRECEAATTSITESYRRKEPIVVTDLYRRKSIKQEVYLAKTGPFRGRCAYCEANIADYQHGEIEHFRPKKAVTDENDAPIVVTGPDGKTVDHPGYFWRAYNWKNLLASCITCNQPGQGGIGKRNRFPLQNLNYAMDEAQISEEEPLLINPIDQDDADPEEHLGVDLKTGAMKFKNDSKRGEMCIKIFGLNNRDQLVADRKAAMNEVKAKFAELLYADEPGASAIRRELDQMDQGFMSFTLARRAQGRHLSARADGLFAAD